MYEILKKNKTKFTQAKLCTVQNKFSWPKRNSEPNKNGEGKKKKKKKREKKLCIRLKLSDCCQLDLRFESEGAMAKMARDSCAARVTAGVALGGAIGGAVGKFLFFPSLKP